MPPLTPEQKIDFLVTVIRSQPEKVDIGLAASATGLTKDGARKRFLAIQKEVDNRAASAKGSGSD